MTIGMTELIVAMAMMTMTLKTSMLVTIMMIAHYAATTSV